MQEVLGNSGSGGGLTWSHPAVNPTTLGPYESVSVTHPSAADYEVLVNVVKKLTSDPTIPTSGGGITATASIAAYDLGLGSPPASTVFDGSVNDGNPYILYPDVPPVWFKVDFGSVQTTPIFGYTIAVASTSGDPGSAQPEDFTLEVSTDDTNWTVVDTQTGVTTGWVNAVKRAFTLASTVTGYRYVRVNITKPTVGALGIEDISLTTEVVYTYGKAITGASDSTYAEIAVEFVDATTTTFTNRFNNTTDPLYISVAT